MHSGHDVQILDSFGRPMELDHRGRPVPVPIAVMAHSNHAVYSSEGPPEYDGQEPRHPRGADDREPRRPRSQASRSRDTERGGSPTSASMSGVEALVELLPEEIQEEARLAFQRAAAADLATFSQGPRAPSSSSTAGGTGGVPQGGIITNMVADDLLNYANDETPEETDASFERVDHPSE